MHTQLKLIVEQLERPFSLTFISSILAIAKFNMFSSSTTCMEYGEKKLYIIPLEKLFKN